MVMLVRATVMLLVTGLSSHVWPEASVDKEPVPSIELLEFLGQWTDEYGDEIEWEVLEEARMPTSQELPHRNRFQSSPGGEL